MSDLVNQLLALADCDARAGEPLGKCMREAAARIAELEAAQAEAAAAWEAFKRATVSDDHFAAVARLDAALGITSA